MAGCVVSVGSVHAAEDHVPAGEAGLQPVVHILPVAECEVRADGLSYGVDEDASAGFLPAESMAPHARHLARADCAGESHPARESGAAERLGAGLSSDG